MDEGRQAATQKKFKFLLMEAALRNSPFTINPSTTNQIKKV